LIRFKAGAPPPGFGSMAKQLEAAFGHDLRVLTNFNQKAWGLLCDFTHTGFHQVTRRHRTGEVAASYPERELRDGLRMAMAFGLMAGQQLAYLGNRADLLQAFADKMREISGQ
jgi:hypothetical protein